MGAQKVLTRSDSMSNLVDVVNKIVDRDKGSTWDVVIWRPDSSTYGLDLDNAQGYHANFGNGVLLINDTTVSTIGPIDILGQHALRVWNAGNTNSANLYHSGTNDVMKTDDGFQVAVALNVGAAISAADAGDIFAAGGISAGTYSNPSAGQILGTAGLSIGTYANAAGGQGYFSGGLSVGTATVLDAGDIYGSGGLTVGTYGNPSAGQILGTSGAAFGTYVNAGTGEAYASNRFEAPRVVSTVATGTAPFTCASQTVVGNLNADMVDGSHASAFAFVGTTNTFTLANTFSALITAAKGIQVTGGDTPAAVGSVIKTAAGGLALRGVTGSSADFVLVDAANTTNLIENLTGTTGLRFNGGIMAGSVTNQGAGTINVATNVYKNGTAYTNPHGGFEKAYTGRLDQFADRMAAMGLPEYAPLSLDDLEAYTRKHFHFPYFADDEHLGLFDGGERLLLITEELATHLFSLHHRLAALEARAA
jgi:hypothetical protein